MYDHENYDNILDLDKNSITLKVSENDIKNRLENVSKPILDVKDGYLGKFNKLVGR